METQSYKALQKRILIIPWTLLWKPVVPRIMYNGQTTNIHRSIIQFANTYSATSPNVTTTPQLWLTQE